VPEPVDLIVCAAPERLLPGARAIGKASGSISAAAQPSMPPATPRELDLVRLLERATSRLQPHSTLICGLAGAPPRAVTDLLARILPAADVWLAPPQVEAGASFVVIVQGR
jgi:hypothetical protein